MAGNRDAQGALWLQKGADSGSGAKSDGNALEIVVHKGRSRTAFPSLLDDPRVELHVAGKNREELLGRQALPAGFVPMALDSPLPRAGRGGRSPPRPGAPRDLHAGAAGAERGALARASPLTSAPEGPWRDGEEVWVFEAKNDYRVVTWSRACHRSIRSRRPCPTRGRLLRLAYPMKVGDTLVLDEKRREARRRSAAEPALPQQVPLWLDFDGTELLGERAS